MTEVTFLVWPLSVATICSSFLSNTTTFLSAPPRRPQGTIWNNQLLQIMSDKSLKISALKKWSQCTGENFAGVWGTQIQSQNSRNTGTMKTLKVTQRETHYIKPTGQTPTSSWLKAGLVIYVKGSWQKSGLTAWEATWRYLLRSSALTSSSGTVFPLCRSEIITLRCWKMYFAIQKTDVTALMQRAAKKYLLSLCGEDGGFVLELQTGKKYSETSWT